MLGLRSVASLASNHHVLTQLFLIYHIGMATFAGIVPGKRHRPGRGLSDGCSAIVAILSKAKRHDSSPQNHKCHQR